MNPTLLPLIAPGDIAALAPASIDDHTREQARRIIDAVRARGEPAVREFAARFDGRCPSDPLLLDRSALDDALASIPTRDRDLLMRVADRVRAFALAQRAMFRSIEIEIPGGRCGHDIVPIRRAACYAPGGRSPLPSSVLMTAIPARVAQCEHVVVASPNSSPIMLAAAAIAGADAFLAVGGAHAIAALALGMPPILDRCDTIVGPGNRWVTAAKQLLAGDVGIDMLAGPSELLILADDTGDPSLIAADLLAQGEHDTDARAMLITTEASLPGRVVREIEARLPALATARTARIALSRSFACVARDTDEMIRLADRIAPEHLEIHARDAVTLASRVGNAGAVFLGSASAEVLGDYGVGPNHTLPTGGSARFHAGLSVQHFLRLRTWLRVDDADLARPLAADARDLATLEHLPAHADAARARA